nr:TRAP transporter small permease [Flavimaribacter sediminis]
MISVIGGVVWKPFPGDFEMTEVGVAIAAFSFLPYCQLTYSNVTADIFTSRASPRTIAFLTAIASIVALLFSLLLCWRMFDGMLDQKEYGYTTAILQFPHWMAFIPFLISLALLAIAALITFGENAAVLIGNKSDD